MPVEVEYASEFRYRNPPDRRATRSSSCSRSRARRPTRWRPCARRNARGIPRWPSCNVVGSTIAREADGGIYLHAGPEIGVASTKAFTAQVAVLTMLALYLGRLRHLSFPRRPGGTRRASSRCPTRWATVLTTDA